MNNHEKNKDQTKVYQDQTKHSLHLLMKEQIVLVYKKVSFKKTRCKMPPSIFVTIN